MDSELEAYRRLSKLFRRFVISKTEMIENEFTVEGFIYNGMGDFTSFKQEGKTLEEAVNKIIEEYCEFFQISKEKMDILIKKIK
jgi:hypothetical protein